MNTANTEPSPVGLSVIIPAYNEEARIETAVRAVLDYVRRAETSHEVIVVDDGSRDRTADIAGGIDPAVNVLRNPGNRGKGYSVRSGMLASRGRIALFSDADLSTPIEEFEKFRPWFERGFDVVIGSRALPDSDIRVRQPWYRETMGKSFNLIVQLLVVRGITDTQCGFKAFSRKAVDAVFRRQRIERWGFDPELLYVARRHGLSIKDVPVTWLNRAESRVHPIKASAQMIVELMRIRLNAMRGRYR